MNIENIDFQKQNHIAVLSFNRPLVLNALNSNVLEELDKILDETINDEEIYVLVITGQGKLLWRVLIYGK